MQPHRKFITTLLKLPSKFWRTCKALTKQFVNWILRGLFFLERRDRLANRGFILPTVMMVMLVVVLLTTALVLRSFDRSRSASNIRVNEAVLRVAAPALDRAKSKINLLFEDPTLPRSTPTDTSLYNVIKTNPKYTFGDEERLKIAFDLNANNSINTGGSLEQDETSTTAWRFPADTDNNGRYDSYVLYGIYFRSPTRGTNGVFDRERKPLDARTPPMDNTNVGGACSAALGTSASLVGSSDWYKAGPNLKKSFFVYTVTVPITGTPPTTPVNGKGFERFSGTNQGFAAVEYQQDRTRVPLSNNAVLYEDDLVIAPGSGIRLNGRIMTNSNLFAGEIAAPIELFQVSGFRSCFYQEENSKIIVGGNIGRGSPGDNQAINGDVSIDLFKPGATPGSVNLVATNQTTNQTYSQVYYNSDKYEDRLGDLVNSWVTSKPTANDNTANAADPDDVRTSVAAGTKTRLKALDDYFRDRLRKVPVNEATGTGTFQGTGNALRPIDTQVFPVNPTNNNTSNNGLTLRLQQPPATEPEKLKQDGQGEQRLGDRILVGNGLPAKWFDAVTNTFVGQDTPQFYAPANPPSTDWTAFGDISKRLRSRTTGITPLSDLGNTEPGGFWEQKAAEQPLQRLDGVGGLRIVTSAGIYRPTGSFLPRPSGIYAGIDTRFDDLASFPEVERTLNTSTNPTTPNGFVLVWPDTMPMSDGNGNRGDLMMRASVVYHYRQSSIVPGGTNNIQAPMACVSSYYDPTNSQTARNRNPLPAWQNGTTSVATGRSNNGIVYGVPGTTAANLPTGSSTNGLFTPVSPDGTGTYRARLNYQANLIFPNGRFANLPLREALKKLDTQGRPKLTLADQAAIDSAICGLYLADDATAAPSNTLIPHGAIYETAFLDAREVKTLDNDPKIQKYDLPLEERQPSEVRATVVNLDLLRRFPNAGVTDPAPLSPVPGPEYLLPDSGIVYVTRNDALPDASFNSFSTTTAPTTVQESNNRQADRRRRSPVDFVTDATRRPNGVLLINGGTVARGGNTNTFKDTEKGLILATNLPVYVQADANNSFNAHASTLGGTEIEEFSTPLTANPSRAEFYNRNGLNPNFACRKNDPRLPNCTAGDLWRPVTVVADGVTLLSNNFRPGFREEGDFDLRKNVEGKNVASLNDRVLIAGYDVSGDNTISTSTTVSEAAYGFDLNGNGTTTENVQEDRISVKGVRRLNGFFDNNYVTSISSQSTMFGIAGFPLDLDTVKGGFQGSSYLHNGVTPVQRRIQAFSEYVMEYCAKPAIELCTPADWKVGLTSNANAKATWDGTTLGIPKDTPVANLQAGTTVRAPVSPVSARYPRRIAFLRDLEGRLLLDGTANRPIPLGIDSTGKVQYYPYGPVDLGGATPAFGGANIPGTGGTAGAALWYRTTTNLTNPNTPTPGEWTYNATNPLYYHHSLVLAPPAAQTGAPAGLKRGTTQQPLLAPVLQIATPTATAVGANLTLGSATIRNQLGNGFFWVQTPLADTTFNLVVAGGDTPIEEGEANGGLGNFVRYLELWNNTAASRTVKFSGSIIQFKRSAYADAPWQPLLATAIGSENNRSLFDRSATYVTGKTYPRLYRTNVTPIGGSDFGLISFYTPPTRRFGYDVGLLSQLPDLFSQRFTTPSTGEPDEFYREVPRDDAWVKGLMCAAVADSSNKVGAAGATYTQYAIADVKQRPPSGCPNLPYPPNL